MVPMGLFRRTKPAPPEAEERGADLAAAWGGVLASHGLLPGSSVPVTPESSMRVAAAWACIRQLTATITTLPIDVVRVSANSRQALPTAQQPKVIRQPDARLSRRAWVGQVVRSALSEGNVYGDLSNFDGMGRPQNIGILSPSSVSWLNGAPYVDGVKRDLWPQGDLWHMPVSFLLPPGGRVAMSPIRYAATAIGTSLAAEQFGLDFFNAGGMPVSDLTMRGKGEPTRDQIESMREQVELATRHRKTFVHGETVDLKAGPQVNAKDSQYVDLLRFETEQMCRFFGVPPSFVFAATSGQNVTYANVSQADLHYLKHSVAAWLVDIEDALSDFIVAPQVVKFNVDAILRMDAASRTMVQAQRLQMKTLTVNEVRVQEDQTPFPDPIYDQPGIPGDTAGVVGMPDVVAPPA